LSRPLASGRGACSGGKGMQDASHLRSAVGQRSGARLQNEGAFDLVQLVVCHGSHRIPPWTVDDEVPLGFPTAPTRDNNVRVSFRNLFWTEDTALCALLTSAISADVLPTEYL